MGSSAGLWRFLSTKEKKQEEGPEKTLLRGQEFQSPMRPLDGLFRGCRKIPK